MFLGVHNRWCDVRSKWIDVHWEWTASPIAFLRKVPDGRRVLLAVIYIELRLISLKYDHSKSLAQYRADLVKGGHLIGSPTACRTFHRASKCTGWVQAGIEQQTGIRSRPRHHYYFSCDGRVCRLAAAVRTKQVWVRRIGSQKCIVRTYICPDTRGYWEVGSPAVLLVVFVSQSVFLRSQWTPMKECACNKYACVCSDC